MFLRIVLFCVAVSMSGLAMSKNFRWSSAGDITTQDPHGQDESFTKSFNAMVYERLLMPGKDMSSTPWLATGWKTVSPTQRVFTLRKDVKFQDGTPMTADDVVFSFDRAAKSKQFRTYTSQAGTARKIDDYTVEFTTASPNPISQIAIGEIPIMSKAWATKNNAVEPQDFSVKEPTFASRNAMGTGPFKLVSYEPGVKTVLARNPDWWGVKDGRWESNIDTMEYRPIASPATRMAALKSGEIDFVLDPPVQDIAKMKEDRDFKVWEGDETRVITITLDQARDELLFPHLEVAVFLHLRDVLDRRIEHEIDLSGLECRHARGRARDRAVLDGLDIALPALVLDAPPIGVLREHGFHARLVGDELEGSRAHGVARGEGRLLHREILGLGGVVLLRPRLAHDRDLADGDLRDRIGRRGGEFHRVVVDLARGAGLRGVRAELLGFRRAVE